MSAVSGIDRLAPQSPLSRRLLAWAGERFTLANAALFLPLYLIALLCGKALTRGGALSLSAADFAGFLGAWAFFLMLRVFDEHKDYELDAVNHPDRVLQRGLVTLDHLKAVGVVAIATQLAVSLIADGGLGETTIWWCLTMGWSALMAKEFFARKWLVRRPVLYAFTHMLVMPLAVLWWAQIGAGGAGLPTRAAWLGAFGFLIGATVEVARKTNAPADERRGVDSYTKSLGIYGTVGALVALLAAAASVGGVLLGAAAADAPAAVGALAGSVALAAVALVRFAARPVTRRSQLARAAVAVAVLVQLAVLLATLLIERSVA
jgi:4-hydroxybenzoate polyprenyltransferase